MADLVIQFYNECFYDAEKMKLFVKVGWLTSEQYQEVTGSDYVQSL
ncbi:XkdX family protein [Weissella confusa]|nr:XkdX family protein [Weissella confusa]MCT0040307.1 XkdX family protein [Weissella confusa]